jgi:DNA-binding PadR family transcriptional regulator
VSRRDDAAKIEELLPLSPPVYHVLLALGTDTLHGYAIMQAFEDLTEGAERLLPGTLYATLARMVETGLIEEAEPPDESTDARRRYYRLTPHGRRVAAAESDRMRRLLDVADAQNVAPEGAR